MQVYEKLHPDYKLYVRLDDLELLEDLRSWAMEYEVFRELQRAHRSSPVEERTRTIANQWPTMATVQLLELSHAQAFAATTNGATTRPSGGGPMRAGQRRPNETPPPVVRQTHEPSGVAGPLHKMDRDAAPQGDKRADRRQISYQPSSLSICGCPQIIITDNGRQFRSHQFRGNFKSFGVEHYISQIYAPHCNSVERANRTIKTMIRQYVGRDHKKWDRHLAALQFVIIPRNKNQPVTLRHS